MKKVLLIFGTSPRSHQDVPLVKELKSRPSDFDVSVCVTGQHREMLDQVLRTFGIVPDYDLAVMKPGQTLFGVTCGVMLGIKSVLERELPDVALVHGDTTTSFCCGARVLLPPHPRRSRRGRTPNAEPILSLARGVQPPGG